MSWNPIEWVTGLGKAVTEPLRDVIVRKEARKEAHQTAQSQLHLAEENNETTIEISKLHLDEIMQGTLDKSWKDEFVTVCFVGMVPAVMLGGVLHGFGYPQFLVGVLMGISALNGILALGPIMTTVVVGLIPERFDLVNRTWRVRLISAEHMAWLELEDDAKTDYEKPARGMCDPYDAIIYLNRDAHTCDADFVHTFWHEYAHALLFAQGHFSKKAHHEESVDKFGALMAQFWNTCKGVQHLDS